MAFAPQKTLLALVCISFSIVAATDGWELLLNNQPLEAYEAFKAQMAGEDPVVSASGMRGMATAANFLGRDSEAMSLSFKSFLTDHDTILFDAAWHNTLMFSRSWSGHLCEEGYDALEELTAGPTIYNGEHFSSLVGRLVNDDKLRKAGKIMDQMGVVRTFRMIGPFENVSGSGYKKVYPPETELVFDTTYVGKDGGNARWFPFYNSDPNGWVFTEYNFGDKNAALYYYTNVKSDMDKTVTIGFGASGAFTVFLNDNRVLADSVFRNTGTDMFMQQVKLFKGDNKLLIKLAHEQIHSNFLIRFLDQTGKAAQGLAFTNDSGTFRKGENNVEDLRNSPMVDRVTSYLDARLAEDSADHEAAVLLMGFYNTTELTDKGQALARAYLDTYPQSSMWHGFLSESLLRSRKLTESQTHLRTAYKLCELNASAWANELEIVSGTAGSQRVLEFVDSSPEEFRKSAEACVARIAHYAQSGNEAKSLEAIRELEEMHASSTEVIRLLVAFHAAQGETRRAEKLIKKLIKWQRSSTEAYSMMADLYMKQGKRTKAFKAYQKCLRYSPNTPGFHYYLAKLLFQLKDYTGAEAYLKQGLACMPTSSSLLNLKGAILAAQDKKAEAIDAFKEAIGYDYSNFPAWDQLLLLQGKPTLQSLVSMPTVDTLIALSQNFEHLDGENGAIIANVKDVFYYPSGCSRERYFMLVRLPTQNAIDIWKEYSIPYNGYYQVLNINRAISRNAAGAETPADVSSNSVVFKTLQPNDYIVLEWTLENYYTGGMAKQVWGERSFDLPYPVFLSVLRLVTPETDTIPYIIEGDSIEVELTTASGFRITGITRKPYWNPPRESFALIDGPGTNRVYYSTIKSWGSISEWYLNLTDNKLEQTAELRALADSLFEGTASNLEKVSRLHSYLTGSIRYSYVPFRQSAWVPQPAREVLATKIGDCKDMSSLAKTLLDYAGIPSNLVLVNTRDNNSVYPSFIGPNFNHCIVSYSIDDSTRYLDLTDNNLSEEHLPKMDQGSLGLIIADRNDSLVHLPVDNPAVRSITRTITSKVDENGTLTRNVNATKTGIFAGRMRSIYRHSSYSDQKKALQQVLVESFPDMRIDTLIFHDLDSLSDSLNYEYRYVAGNAVNFSGNTAILPLNLPDAISGKSFPSEEERHYDIDMSRAWYDVGTFSISGEIEIPEGWRPITTPEPINIKGKYGEYELTVQKKGDRIIYTREAAFNFDEAIPAGESGKLREFLSAVAKADNVNLLFFTK